MKKLIRKDVYCTNDTSAEHGPAGGQGVIVTPSYLEHLNILPEICDNLKLPSQKDYKNLWFGADEENAKTDTVKTITDKIIAFIVSVYQSGSDGRGYVSDTKNMVVYNQEKKTMNATMLNTSDYYDYPCKEGSYKFINDTIIEMKTASGYEDKNKYTFETAYKYNAITKDGEIRELKSDRHYNFTKHIVMDESYFEGCYAKFLPETEWVKDSNICFTEHLDMEDLDIMINEIYADYGLKFKTEKWQTYFGKQAWYKPLYDNVENKLSPIDKKNIETIAKEKIKIKGREKEYTKKHYGMNYAAG